MKKKTSLPKKKNYTNIITVIVFICVSLVIFIPILITVFASFKDAAELRTSYPLAPPARFSLENYKTVLAKGNILTGYANSFTIVVVTIVINTFLAGTISYALNRFDFALKKLFFFLFMLGMIVPVYVTEISRFGVIKMLHLFNTRMAAVIIYAAADLMQIFIYIQFMNKIPISLDESAMIDGASYYRIYFKVIMPLTLPAIATLGILKGVEIMNDMYIPYLYMPSPKLNTISTTIMRFAGTRYARWEYMSAAIILVMIPTFLLYIALQKHVIKGITAGAVKA